MENLFDLNLAESELIDTLSKMKFKKIGEGYAAHVFCNTEQNVVLKIFPPLSAGGPEDLNFIKKNYFLRYADILTVRWQNIPTIKWVRQKAKSFVSYSFRSNNIVAKEQSCEQYIRAYDISIKKGLMKELPTRIISNCISKLSLKVNKSLMRFLSQPDKIILQKCFKNEDVLLNSLKSLAQQKNISECHKLIKDAVNIQVHLWNLGLACIDMSFDMFDNILLLSDGKLQMHDVNSIIDSFPQAMWYIREKEKDLKQIFDQINAEKFPNFLYNSNDKGISETARKLYSFLPQKNRNELTMQFLVNSHEILTERKLLHNWKGSM